MIVGKGKPVEEVLEMVEGYDSILVVGCNSCMAMCLAGGEKEVAVLASALRLAFRAKGREVGVEEAMTERQCEWEFVETIGEKVESAQAVVSMACGVGPQTMARKFPEKPIYPGINTSFMGQPEETGVWSEQCAGCGDCVLDQTGTVCPIARCAKSMLNGPCGGAQDGKCEVGDDTDCAWQLIYDRLKSLGQLHRLEENIVAKDWSTDRDGGPRTIVREDVRV